MFHLMTTADCKYCKLAKSALTARAIDYTEEVLTAESWKLHKETGFQTVPQIWVKIETDHLPAMQHIGGFTDLISYLSEHFPE